MSNKPNIVVIVSDTLRACDVGCYGSKTVHTPEMDAFAKRSMRFTRAFPESLPTIPVRRALFTGRRCFPFRNYKSVKWDIVYMPGWQPMSNEEDTVAESLAELDYHTGFVTDTWPYFAPGFNFQRGFYQWEFVRGQLADWWRSPFSVPDELLKPYGDVKELRKNRHNVPQIHLANTAHVKSEEDTSTARVFQWGMQFLEDNLKGQPFYLVMDCFDPHEPWDDTPKKYLKMYGDPDYKGKKHVFLQYGPVESFGYKQEELDFVVANYRGKVTMVDHWFGRFIKKLDDLGLAGNTAVLFISDHGTNFTDNPCRVVGKPHNYMYPAVMDLPYMVRLPDESGAGTVCDQLVYNFDMPATIYDLAGAKSKTGLDGQSLLPLLKRGDGWKSRPYVTCSYNHSACYIDDDTWAFGDIDGTPAQVFDLNSDPACFHALTGPERDKRWKKAWAALLRDAGGKFPDYRVQKQTDAIGQKPIDAD